jgi:excisionase family DNA binding protein
MSRFKERHYKPAAVAEMLDVKVSTVYRWLRTGKLPCIAIGQTRFVPTSALRAAGLGPKDLDEA